MDNIVKCTNEKCPMRDSCKRAAVLENDFLSEEKFDFKTIEIKGQYFEDSESYACEFFIIN